MAKSLRAYLPESREEIVLVQARVNRSLADQVKSVCKVNGWSQADAIRAGLMKLVDDEGPKPCSFTLKRLELDHELSDNKSAWK